MTNETIQPSDEDKLYTEKLNKNSALLAKLLADNKVKPKTKKAYELAYAFFYGAYGGNLSAGILICLMSGRLETLLPKVGEK